jgi:hypothetical protein
MPPPNNEGEGRRVDTALLGSLASGLVSIFSLQLLSRVLTFALNVAIVRRVDRTAYGVGSVQLQLVCDAVLALSREGFRDACQRTPTSTWHNPESRARVLAVAWLCVPFAAVVGTMVLGVSSFFGSGQDEGGFSAAGISGMFVAAAGLEILSEPLYILAHNLLLISIRVRVEMCALLCRILTIAVLVTLYPAAPLRAFALGTQLNPCPTLQPLSSDVTSSSCKPALRCNCAVLTAKSRGAACCMLSRPDGIWSRDPVGVCGVL